MKNELLKNTLLLTIGNIGSRIITLILVPLYTKWLMPSEYGNYDLINAILTFLVPILTLQVEQSIFRYINIKKHNKKEIFTVAVEIVIITIALMMVTTFFLINKIKIYKTLLALVAIQCIYTLLKEYLRGEGKLLFYTVINMLNAVVILFTNILFLGILKLSIDGILKSYIISYVFCSFLVILFERPFTFKISTIKRKSIIKLLLSFSIPLIPNTISFWIINLSDRFMINYYIGSYENGLYAVACKLPTLITTFYGAFVLAWQQEVIKLLEEKEIQQIGKIFVKLINFIFPFVFVVTAALPFIYRLFINDRYFSSIKLVPILLIGTVMLAISQFINGILIADLRTYNIGISTTIAALVNIIINFFFLERYGIIVAAFSTFLSYMILLCIRLIYIRNIIFNIKKKIEVIIIFSLVECALIPVINKGTEEIQIATLIICITAFLVINKSFLTKTIMFLQKK